MKELLEKIDRLPMIEAWEFESRVDALVDPLEDAYRRIAELERQVAEERETAQASLREELGRHEEQIVAALTLGHEYEMGKKAEELIEHFCVIHDFAVQEVIEQIATL